MGEEGGPSQGAEEGPEGRGLGPAVKALSWEQRTPARPVYKPLLWAQGRFRRQTICLRSQDPPTPQRVGSQVRATGAFRARAGRVRGRPGPAGGTLRTLPSLPGLHCVLCLKLTSFIPSVTWGPGRLLQNAAPCLTGPRPWHPELPSLVRLVTQPGGGLLRLILPSTHTEAHAG